MSELTLYDYLPFFNKEGEIFMQLIGDPRRPELPVITNINDINQGAIANALIWHMRFKDEAVRQAMDAADAVGIFLNEYRKLYNVPGIDGQTDEEYAAYMVETLTSTSCSFPRIAEILDDPGITVFEPAQMGMFSDYSASDVRVMPPDSPMRLRSGIPTYPAGALYLYVSAFTNVTAAMILQLRKTMAAGTAIFVGVHS